MATHFVCQPTEPLAHRYPLVQKAEKTHGAVSDYEAYNLGNKAHTQFPPPGWDTSQSSEESLPLCQAPVPSWKHSSDLIGPDPILSVTPDKMFPKKKQYYPHPTQTQPTYLITPDPDLCITPEKALEKKEQKSNLKTDKDVNIKSKCQQKVRFDVENIDSDKENTGEETLGKEVSSSASSKSGKTYSPADYSGDENFEGLNFGKESESENLHYNNKAKQYTVKHIDSRAVYVPLTDHGLDDNFRETGIDTNKSYKSILPSALPSTLDKNSKLSEGKTISVSLSKSKHSSKERSKSIEKSKQPNTNALTNIPKDPNTKRKVRVTRETAERPTQENYKFPFGDGVESVLEYEHVFNRPEYNSTLRVRKELEHVKDSCVDVEYAVGRKLASSETKLSEIKEKAASQVNHVEEESRFTGLVSLEVPLENIKAQLEQEKTAKIKRSKIYKSQVSKDGKEPDLMEFFTPDLQQEFAELSLPGLQAPVETLSTAPHRSAYDLYRHNRVWDCTSNFKTGK